MNEENAVSIFPTGKLTDPFSFLFSTGCHTNIKNAQISRAVVTRWLSSREFS